MSVWQQLVEFFTSGANWSGSGGIPTRVLEHLWMSGLTLLIAGALALPPGLAIGHTRRAEFLAVSVGNVGRALPSFGVLGLVFPFTLGLPGEIGFWPTLIALVLLAIPPILTNSYVGIQTVDEDTLEAARGMGLTGGQLLRRLEIPLAAPIIVTGLRIAALQVVATATLGALAGWGGLGRFIVDGFAVSRIGQGMVLGGAILVAALAIVTELAFSFLARMLAPRTSSTGRSRVPRPDVAPDPGKPEEVLRS